MTQFKSLLFIFLVLLSFQCSPLENDIIELSECETSDYVKSKELVGLLLKGDWEWIRSNAPRRGFPEAVETPNTLKTKRVYKFENNLLRIFENGNNTQTYEYEIKYWGEGSNHVDQILMLWYYDKTSNINLKPSMIHLNATGNCLRLINSYDCAGTDLTLVRMGQCLPCE